MDHGTPQDTRRARLVEVLTPAGSPPPEPPPDGRVHLAGYESLSGIPASCVVCGDDVDLHEWFDIEDGVPVGCDRR
jgi:hypothetical protein